MSEEGVEESQKIPSIMWFLRRLMTYLRPYRARSLMVLAVLLLETIFGAMVPLSMKFIIDDVLVDRDRQALLRTILFLAVSGLTLAVAGFGRDYLVTRIQARVLSDLRSKLFEHLQKLSLKFYSRTQAGEITARFSTDLASVEESITTIVPWGLLPAMDCITSTIILIILDWRLAAIALLIWPWCLLVPRSLVPKVSAESYRQKVNEAEILSAVQENVSAQPVVKAFSLERPSILAFLRRNTDLLRTSMRVGFLTALLERTAEGAIVVLQIVTLGVGAAMAFNGTLQIGTLATFQALFITMSYTLLYFAEYVGSVPPAAAGLQRIEDLLGESMEVSDAPNATALPRLSKSIEFRNARFGYSESGPILSGVGFTIPCGSSAALVGPSGSGKSTLLSLLMRFYDPNEGAVAIDGSDLRSVTQRSLRGQIGVVFQESFLFNTTLRENIRLGRPDATDSEVEAAARAAEIHEFIMSLPEGYETSAGERGGRLSGGQRQRVAIARALVRNPAILLLDEATSALDPETEQAINTTINRVAQGRTLIFVTHRLASAAQADKIFVFNKGELVEQGNHRELIGADRTYAHLWKKQAGFRLLGDSVEVELRRLKELPILSGLDAALLSELAGHLTTEQFPADRLIVHQGDPGSRFYIIVRGTAAVERVESEGASPRVLAILQDGDFFGEIALLKDSPRTATVRAIQPCLCVSLSRQTFRTLLGKHPQVHEQVTAVAQARYAKLGGTW